MNSVGTVPALALGVAAPALPLALTDVLVGTTFPDDRTMVDVAVAWYTVRVIVVVASPVTVVSCAKTEGARMTARVAMAAVKRILVREVEDECI